MDSLCRCGLVQRGQEDVCIVQSLISYHTYVRARQTRVVCDSIGKSRMSSRRDDDRERKPLEPAPIMPKPQMYQGDPPKSRGCRFRWAWLTLLLLKYFSPARPAVFLCPWGCREWSKVGGCGYGCADKGLLQIHTPAAAVSNGPAGNMAWDCSILWS